MKPRLCLPLLAVLLPLCFFVGCNNAAEDEIREVYDSFERLTDAKDGAGVVDLIDEKYFEQMDYLMNAARTATHDKVFKMSPSERCWIVTIRNRLTKDEMAKLDGRGLCKLSIDRGWDLEDAGEQEDYSLGAIKFKPPRATAEMLVNGEPSGFRYEFVEVNHKWKIDPSCVDQFLDKLIELLARKSGYREDTWIKEFEGAATGKVISEAIWDPPK